MTNNLLSRARHLLDRAGPNALEEAAYRRIASKGFRPGAIVDVGAYHGNWTKMAKQVFPDAPTLMVEAQQVLAPILKRICADIPDVRFIQTLLGPRPGEEVTFYEMESGSSIMPEQSNVERTERKLVTRTLDEVVAEGLPADPRLFLKIDVQGAELEVLEGGTKTLDRSDLVQLEVSLLPYNQGGPTFLEVVAYMDDRDFVPFDFSNFARPKGCELAQVDMLFVPRESPLRPTYFAF